MFRSLLLQVARSRREDSKPGSSAPDFISACSVGRDPQRCPASMWILGLRSYQREPSL